MIMVTWPILGPAYSGTDEVRHFVYVDAAYYYRPSLSVCHDREPCKNGWTDRHAIWGMDSREANQLRNICIIMATLCNRAGHYIFALWFTLSSIYLSSYFPRLISAVADWMSTILPHEFIACRSETWRTRLAENTGRKKSSKIRHLGTIAQLCQAVSFQLRHVSTIGKKVLNSNISSTCPHNMVNFGPLTAEVGLPVWAP